MTKSDFIEYFSKHPMFTGLEHRVLEVMASHAKKESFKDGVLIFRQQTDAEAFYAILEGEVAVEIPALYGAPINMQTLKVGDILGWSWIFPPYKWHFDARATEDTEVITIDGTLLRTCCDEDPAMGYVIVKHFASFMMERLNASRSKVMEMYGPDS